MDTGFRKQQKASKTGIIRKSKNKMNKNGTMAKKSYCSVFGCPAWVFSNG